MKTVKIEILTEEVIEPYGSIAGKFTIEESNIENIAKHLNIDYIGGDYGYSEAYIFEVDEKRVDEVIKELEKIDFINYASIYNEKIRTVFHTKNKIADTLEDLESISEDNVFDESKWNKGIENIEILIKKLKNIYSK
jgi:hypothetical protein